MATVLFGLSVTSTMSVAAIIGALLLGWVVFQSRPAAIEPVTPVADVSLLLLFAITAFAAATAFGLPPRGIGPTSEALETLPAVVWLALAIYVYVRRNSVSRLQRAMVLVLAIAFTGLVGVLHIDAAGGVGLDVLVLHEQAANAIESGINPYTEAVSVPDGAPTAEPGDVITGYVYPPITALFYSLGEWTFADPRYTSLMSWLVFLGVLGFQATRTRSVAPLLALLLMASIPGWPLVLRAAWTEPLSLAMAALAFQYWERASVSGVFLGMTLGSKQYFVVTAPILALYRDSGWARRAMWAVAIVGGTVGLALALDFEAFWSSAVAFHLSTPPRPDSLNLVGLLAATGLEVEFPSVLPVVVGLVASIVVGRWARNRVQFFSGLAFTLAASFVFSSQAFPNYWFLTAGLCGIVMVSAYSPTVADKSSSDALSERGHSDG